jgi:large subunit ribosomal protein L7/L12
MEETKTDVVVPAKFAEIVAGVEKLTLIELHELVKLLEEKWGVSAAAAVVAGPAAGGAAVEEKTSFDVELTAAGATPIQVIKAIKEVLALGLKEAKDLVDGVPSMLKAGMKKEEAEAFKKKIEDAGGKVNLK